MYRRDHVSHTIHSFGFPQRLRPRLVNPGIQARGQARVPLLRVLYSGVRCGAVRCSGAGHHGGEEMSVNV